MKDNPFNDVKEGALERLGWVREQLKENWKNVKPFNKEKIPNSDMLYIYENMSPEDEQYIRMTYGDEAVALKFSEIEKIRRRKDART